MEESRNDDIQKINNFIVDNEELDFLTDKLEQFNVFDILGVSHYEIRHSNTLAWLFDSKEHHGYSDKFFRRFISRVLHESEDDKIGIHPASIELSDYSDLQVFREWRNIDLVLVSEKNKLCVIIENKIHAKESKGQLARYLERVQEQWSEGYTVIPIFLTLDGEDPSDDGKALGYLPVSFLLVLDILEKLQNSFKATQNEEIQGFIYNYLQVIKRLTMQDEDITNLCKSIYRKHKKAIDLIANYGKASQVYDACQEVLTDSGVIDLQNPQNGFMKEAYGLQFFVPDELGRSMREVELSRWSLLPKQYPIACWFKKSSKRQNIKIALEVGPIIDYELRTKILELFKDNGFSFRKDAFNEGKLYTRVYTKSMKLELDENEFESIKKSAKSLLNGLMKKLEPVLAEIARVVKE